MRPTKPMVNEPDGNLRSRLGDGGLTDSLHFGKADPRILILDSRIQDRNSLHFLFQERESVGYLWSMRTIITSCWMDCSGNACNFIDRLFSILIRLLSKRVTLMR